MDEILKISEIFTSIQSEGHHAGRPMHFIRLAGCNLKCIYCDTNFGDYPQPREYAINELLEILKEKKDLPLYITGGEPLIQQATTKLLDEIVKLGFEAFIDTNGTLDLSVIHQSVKKIIDIKTPGSFSGGEFKLSNLKYIANEDEIKFVVTSKNDFDWGIEQTKSLNLLQLTPYVLFQPAWNVVTPRDLAEWVISCGLPVRISIQIHKYIWGPNVSGV